MWWPLSSKENKTERRREREFGGRFVLLLLFDKPKEELLEICWNTKGSEESPVFSVLAISEGQNDQSLPETISTFIHIECVWHMIIRLKESFKDFSYPFPLWQTLQMTAKNSYPPLTLEKQFIHCPWTIHCAVFFCPATVFIDIRPGLLANNTLWPMY